jgi:hypothetical protein
MDDGVERHRAWPASIVFGIGPGEHLKMVDANVSIVKNSDASRQYLTSNIAFD